MQIDTNDKFEESLNDFKRNIPEKLLIPTNIGYHIAHHLHPHLGYRHLKKIKDYYFKHNKEIYK